MSTNKILLIAFWSAFGIIAGYWVVKLFWRVRSALQRHAAGAAEFDSTRSVIWRDPGPAARLDLAAGPGGSDGEPVPPFAFLEEHTSGSQPCVSVRDARGRVWRVKWGSEVNTEAFCTRLAWAAGYFVETTYFVPEGRIEGVTALQRARACVDENCRFENARFELDETDVVTCVSHRYARLARTSLGLAADATLTQILPGHVVFAQGDQGSVMYVLMEGEAQILLDGKVVETVRPGGILGETPQRRDVRQAAGHRSLHDLQQAGRRVRRRAAA